MGIPDKIQKFKLLLIWIFEYQQTPCRGLARKTLITCRLYTQTQIRHFWVGRDQHKLQTTVTPSTMETPFLPLPLTISHYATNVHTTSQDR